MKSQTSLVASQVRLQHWAEQTKNCIFYFSFSLYCIFLLLFRHNYAIIMLKEGVKHYATYYAY